MAETRAAIALMEATASRQPWLPQRQSMSFMSGTLLWPMSAAAPSAPCRRWPLSLTNPPPTPVPILIQQQRQVLAPVRAGLAQGHQVDIVIDDHVASEMTSEVAADPEPVPARHQRGPNGHPELGVDGSGANLFFQLVSSHFKHASLILTSNLPFARWGDVFGDQVVASAMIDRIVHHAEVVTLKGSSYRSNTNGQTRCPRQDRKIRQNNQRQRGSLFNPRNGSVFDHR
jgi:hypothetical protein